MESITQVQPDFLPRQLEALEYLSPDSDVEQVLYGGGAGGGKTRLGCEWQLLRRLTYPGTRGVIGRNSLKTLKETTLHTFFQVTEAYGLKADKHFTYNQQAGVIEFFNKSQILTKDLFYYPSDPNFDGLGSLEITDYFVDEVAEVSAKAVSILHSRCRYMLNEYDQRPKGLLTCNPSKTWVYNEFYLLSKNNELPSHRAFVPALPSDNPYLPESYLRSLDLLPEYDKQRLKYGNWEFDDDATKLFFTADLEAMFREATESVKKKYITVDVARYGEDKTVIMVWNELHVIAIETIDKSGIDTVVRRITDLMTIHGVTRNNVVADEDGLGGGVVDYLKCIGFKNNSKATKPQTFVNIKNECYFKLAEYIAQRKVSVQPSSKDLKQRVMTELETVKRHNMDKDTRLSVTPKDEIKRHYGFSPDYADCLMMRMYFELHPNKGRYVYV